MVLRMLALAVALAGCNQSLFDNHVGSPDGGGSGGGDGSVASSCPAGCIGDAAADIDGSRAGWRYLEDARDRTWTPMTASGEGFTGAVAGNAITTCAHNGSAAACDQLPGALLVSTAGATSAADPAVELTNATKQVIQLTVRALVPMGQPEQQVRLYRNSREDVLFTLTGAAGSLVERSITVDALAGDRFLVAVAPSAAGATDVGVTFFINTTGDAFPTACQLAVDFSGTTGNDVNNACGAVVDYREWDSTQNASVEVTPQLAPGPFPEMGMAADIPLPRYYVAADTLVRTGDTTTQLWVRHDAFDPGEAATAFSDLDLDAYGGLQIGLYDDNGTEMLEASTCTGLSGTTINCVYSDVTWPAGGGWHFVRVVQSGDQVRVCVDGTRLGSYALPSGKMATTYSPRFGRNVVWTPLGAFFDGGIDDVRAFTGALPCD